jgi:hypothetical protein
MGMNMSMRTRTWRATGLLGLAPLVLVLLAGCQAVETKMLSYTLEDRLHQYDGLVRWGKLDSASKFHQAQPEAAKWTAEKEAARKNASSARARALLDAKDAKEAKEAKEAMATKEALALKEKLKIGPVRPLPDIHVTDFRSNIMSVDSDKREAVVSVHATYYLGDSTVVRSIDEQQRWWFDDGRVTRGPSSWYVDGPPIQFSGEPRSARIAEGIHLGP